VNITVQGETCLWERTLSDRVIRFQVSDLRKERTGIHGRVEIFDAKVVLAWDQFNIERDGDRTRLANKAFGLLESDNLQTQEGEAYFKNDLRHDLDLFAREVWPEFIGQQGAEFLSGDSTSEISFLAKPHILDGGGTILFGPQGKGKSYTALIQAIAIDAGQNGLWACKQRRTLFVNLERSAVSIARRISCVNGAMGLAPDRPLLTLNRRGRSLGEIQEIVKKDVEKHNVELVVVDSLSRTGIGDLNENQAANRGIDALNSFAPSWLALGHTPRDSTEHVYGSTMWDAGADIMLRLTGARQGDRLGIHLEVTKENDIGPQPPLTLAYSFDDKGLLTAEKANVTDFPELVANRRKTLADEIQEYLLGEGEATGTQIANALRQKQPNISRALKADERFLVTRRDGKDVYHGVKLGE
jgi:hypothetical protein